MTSDAILKLEHVAKSYGRQPALIDFSLDVGAGEFVGVLGPNGAGKSTLFQVISGLFVPDDGVVELFGMSYRTRPSDILGNLGVVFQARSVDLEMTVAANLRFHGGLFGLAGKAVGQRIDEVMRLLEIEDKRDRIVRNLSGGEQRRVEVARALLNRPGLLLMDEPSAGLDPTSRAGLVTHMRDLTRRQGTAILWATHLVDELDDADRIVLLNAGRMVAVGTPSELTRRAGAASLTEAYTALTGRTGMESAET